VPAPASASAPVSQQPQSGAGVGKCQAAHLGFTLGTKSQTGQSQGTQVVDMTNKGPAACTLEGFPQVGVLGDLTTQPTYLWSPLVDSSGAGALVTLQPGGTAHFDLVYLPGAAGDGNQLISVFEIVVRTPDDRNNSDSDIQGIVQWKQTLVFQQAATHPGTYVMPVEPGA